jgi:hypothetical protein
VSWPFSGWLGMEKADADADRDAVEDNDDRAITIRSMTTDMMLRMTTPSPVAPPQEILKLLELEDVGNRWI